MSVEVRSSGIEGRGTFALQSFAAGDPVLTLTGETVTPAEVVWRLARRQLRSVDDLVMLSDHWRYLLPDHRSLAVNHSCDPNCGFGQGLQLRALRAIREGEEITFDYALTTRGTVPWRMAARCQCGTPGCRGVIGNVASLPPEAYQRYLAAGSVPPQFRIKRRWRIGPWHIGV